jgi:hypothetical protein
MAALLRHYLPQVRRADAAGFRAWIALHPALADNAPDSPAGSR